LFLARLHPITFNYRSQPGPTKTAGTGQQSDHRINREFAAVSGRGRALLPTDHQMGCRLSRSQTGGYCCRSRKLQGDKFFAKLRNGSNRRFVQPQ
jgi:hypothetical protein